MNVINMDPRPLQEADSHYISVCRICHKSLESILSEHIGHSPVTSRIL